MSNPIIIPNEYLDYTCRSISDGKLMNIAVISCSKGYYRKQQLANFKGC